MYLVAARFQDRESADAALRDLRQTVRVGAGDLGVRQLGSLRYEQPALGLVLAGRFGINDVDTVVEIMNRHGGEIVFRRADWRNPRPLPRAGDRPCARCQRLTRLRT